MREYVGKYESKEKTRRKQVSSAQGCLLHAAATLIGLIIMLLLGWEDDSRGFGRYSTPFCIGLVVIVVVDWLIGAVGNAIRKKRKSSE